MEKRWSSETTFAFAATHSISGKTLSLVLDKHKSKWSTAANARCPLQMRARASATSLHDITCAASDATGPDAAILGCTTAADAKMPLSLSVPSAVGTGGA